MAHHSPSSPAADLDGRRQPRQRLLPGTPEPDQQRIPAGLPQDADDAAQMRAVVTEEHEAHLFGGVQIVFVQILVKDPRQPPWVADLRAMDGCAARGMEDGQG